MVPILITAAGLVLSAALGLLHFSLSPLDVARCIVASNFCGFVGLVIMQTLERTPSVKKNILTGGKSTWTFFAVLFFGSLMLLAPPLRDPRVMLVMALPLCLSNGFAIAAFGPVQDYLIRRSQRRARGQRA